jgi:hypothetical protein
MDKEVACDLVVTGGDGFQLPTTLTTQADPLIGEILNQKNHL